MWTVKMCAGQVQAMAHGIHLVNALSPLVPLPLHPMTIEIGKKTVDVISTGRVSVPLSSVVP